MVGLATVFGAGGGTSSYEEAEAADLIVDGVIDGQVDGAHMLAGQPLAATIGFGTKAHIITPLSMESMMARI